MELMLNIDIKKLSPSISYGDRIMLTGSCFTEHIGNALADLKFSVLQNPNGILFGPDAVSKSLVSYIENKKYRETDLFQLNEIWHSWQHHSRFSRTNPASAVKVINDSQQHAHDFLKSANWLIVTLGSSFSYKLTSIADKASYPIGEGVANCHRAPSQWFDKTLLEIPTIVSMLEDCIERLISFNSQLNIIFTVSPVRHIRDGVVENNRSKARLIESVHHLVSKYEQVHYFPAYELVIDVLRDHRFYDVDLVHPNYPATEFVLEKFTENCMSADTQALMAEIKKIMIARRHRAFQPDTKAHQQFLMNHFEKTQILLQKFPFLDLKEELIYFSQT